MDENNKNDWRVSRAIIYVKNDYPETPLVTVPEVHRKYNLGIAAETIEAVDIKAPLNKKKIRIYELGKDTMFTPEMREPDEHPFIIIKDHGDSWQVKMFKYSGKEIVQLRDIDRELEY